MIKTLVLPVFLVLFITSVLGGAIGGVLPIGGFFQSPIAHIQLPAEAIPGLGIYNTSLTFWVSILVLLSFVFLKLLYKFFTFSSGGVLDARQW